MDAHVSSGERLPGGLAVALVAGLLFGLLPPLLGLVLALGGNAVIGCGQFGDFGCAGYAMLGLWACPGSAAAAALVGGLTAARMRRAGAGCTRRDVWKRSLALAFVSLLLGGPISVSVVASL
jgi:hypothetical protein